ncbi:hypothetical protein CU254_42025 (plasmid) [Amycolatopsis sp. AA4]|uniref:hypothetical protein n=1 Tax=Amycolatopsis sp. AA4 TaxID=1896961 RepID=UPI000C21FCF9|nr:hypothetical protein [Amycolatopsis sp. AA4]ATY17158.1 hypothetical protein CU254_42025 [Amycolatopsis sp. AA4]
MTGAGLAGYEAAAVAAGAWWCRLRVPLDDPGEAVAAVARATRDAGMPLTVALRGGRGDVSEAVLLRAPDLLPAASVDQCRRMAEALAAETGWRRLGPDRPDQPVAPLGLSRFVAFDGGLRGCSADDAARRLFAVRAPGMRARPAWLVVLSAAGCMARREPGVLAMPSGLEQAAEAAAALGLQRWCVLDPAADEHVVFSRSRTDATASSAASRSNTAK